MAKHYISGYPSDAGAVGAAFVQCGGSCLHRTLARGGQHGADRHRAGVSADHLGGCVHLPVRHRRDAAVFHCQRGRRGGACGEDTGKYMFTADGMLCGDFPVLLSVPQTGALSVRGQRRLLCVCGSLSAHLSAGHALCHALHGPERLHQCPGLSADGDDDDPYRGGAESDTGSGLYICTGHGGGRRCPGHHLKPAGILHLGAEVSDREKGRAPYPEAESPGGLETDQGDICPWHVGLYHAGHELSGAGGMQCHAEDIRRRFVRGNHDSD